jgi:hypothetical protein
VVLFHCFFTPGFGLAGEGSDIIKIFAWGINFHFLVVVILDNCLVMNHQKINIWVIHNNAHKRGDTKVKKGIVIAVIFILVVLNMAFAQEQTDGNVVVVGSDTAVSADALSDASAESAATEVIPSQGVCTPQSNILTAAYGKALSVGRWIIGRDYMSAAMNAWHWLLGLSLAIKIIIVLAILIIIFLVWNYNFRNTRANNMKKARKHHLKGEEAHRKGDEEKAREHYEKAREYRERAQDQW